MCIHKCLCEVVGIGIHISVQHIGILHSCYLIFVTSSFSLLLLLLLRLCVRCIFVVFLLSNFLSCLFSIFFRIVRSTCCCHNV